MLLIIKKAKLAIFFSMRFQYVFYIWPVKVIILHEFLKDFRLPLFKKPERWELRNLGLWVPLKSQD